MFNLWKEGKEGRKGGRKERKKGGRKEGRKNFSACIIEM
jgi:hypothetical protein